MPQFKTVVELAAAERLRKNEIGEQSPESAEAELDAMLRDCAASIKDLEGKLAAVQSKFRAGMSPQSKAALDVMGADVKKQIHAVENASIEIQKRRLVIRTTQSRTLAKASFLGSAA